MNEGIELIIFDCDGVLIDSESISSRVETGEVAPARLKPTMASRPTPTRHSPVRWMLWTGSPW